MGVEIKGQKFPGVVSRKFSTIVIRVSPTSVIMFHICPFCFAMYNFPESVFQGNHARCNCGGNFSKLGVTTKYFEEEPIN